MVRFDFDVEGLPLGGGVVSMSGHPLVSTIYRLIKTVLLEWSLTKLNLFRVFSDLARP